MECYFTSNLIESESGNHNALLSFTVPEYGIVFRAQFSGKETECEYASLLSLLEFVEINPQLFKNKTVEIFGDSNIVVNQVNDKMYCNKQLEPFRKMAQLFKKKIPYVLNYIPPKENPAQNDISVS
jgi:ribonuclease HI